MTNAAGAAWGILITTTGNITPKFIEVRGLEVKGSFAQNCVKVDSTSDIVLKNMRVTQCAVSAVSLFRTTRVTLEDSQIHHNALEGWTSPVNLGECRDGNIIRGNSIWSNFDEDTRETEGHGIIMDTCLDAGGVLIENNVIWGNEGWCINVYNSDGATIRNNTCWMNGGGRPNASEVLVRGAHAEIYNNVMVSAQGSVAFGIWSDPDDLSTIKEDFNLMWSPSHEDVVLWPPYSVGSVTEYRSANGHGWGVHTVQSDPKFLNAPAGNYRLDSSSVAVDSGGGLVAADRDHDGFPRPLDGDGNGSAEVDRGAYESGGLFRSGFETGTTLDWSKRSL